MRLKRANILKVQGNLTMYYSGWKSEGRLKTYTIFSASPKQRVYKTRSISATVYPSKTLDIYSTMSESKL